MSSPIASPPVGAGGGGANVTALGWVSVKAAPFNAKGDGSTDDTSAINAAIAALSAGDVLYFPRGRYITQGGHRVTVGCTILGTGRHQVFDSSAQLYQKAGSTADLLTLASPHITIRDLTCYGNKANQLVPCNGIVTDLTVGANYFMLDNVWSDSFSGDNIKLQSPATTLSGTIVNCESRLAGGYGLNVTGTASDVIVSDSYIDQCVQSGALVSAGDVSFANVHVWGNGTAGSGDCDGITLVSAAACRVENSYIESNTNGFGIFCKTGTNTGHQFVGNRIYNNGVAGISLFSTDHSLIVGNDIFRNNFTTHAGGPGAAIQLDTCTAIVTAANTLHDRAPLRQTYGYFEVGNTCADCVYIGNVNLASDHLTGDVVIGAGTTPRIARLWTPADYQGLAGTALPREYNGNAFTPAAGQLFVAKAWVAGTISIANLRYFIKVAGTGATALANCFVGAWTSAGTLLGGTADLSSAWATGGAKSSALTVVGGQSLTINGGAGVYVYLGGLVGTQATTPVQISIYGSGVAAATAWGLTAANLPCGVIGSGLSALANFAPGSLAASGCSVLIDCT